MYVEIEQEIMISEFKIVQGSR